ncbi:MAG: cobalamin-independent methionine synthase II family protein [Candidatus Dormibacteraeota bacterium]|nr:cobalamin-independent methionine synthase II family protein [Candidatus Dormibacteraeota bacterium]MBO0761310.1 cobalamin-independent methionine synthase II family protein [Candidatus Dormibacteraeota bacterium]
MSIATAYHAEHVGSLLRPPELLEARAAYRAGTLPIEGLREAEDRAALDALELQRQAGIEIFTDGEVRRENWMASLLQELGGTQPAPVVDRQVSWRRESGDDPPPEETHFDSVVVAERVYLKEALTSVEATFLAKHAPGQFKITMMSGSMGAVLWSPGLTDRVYASPEDMLQAVVGVQIGEIEGLLESGVSWLQLDSLSYNWIIDEGARARRAIDQDVGPEGMLDRAVRLDNQLIAAARAKNPSVTVGLHFCRGNNRSAWFASGGYDPVAEKLFGEVEADRFLLEYDTERSGGFEPLRFVPRGRTVVLGLVSSKLPELEPVDALQRRIEEASKYVPLEDLALSPQCGFASTAAGNLLTVDQERRKLELVVETARKVWG